MLVFLAGLLIGSAVGVGLMACLAAAKEADERIVEG